MSDTPRTVAERITDYLTSGGLFNPELANHAAVRDLLIDARDELAAAQKDAKRYQWLRDAAPVGAGDMASVRESHSPAEIDAAIDAAIAASKPNDP